MCSSSLRSGDRVSIVSRDGETEFGEFEAAFVKDVDGREVKAPAAAALTGGDEGVRTSSQTPNHIEIICDLDTYLTLKGAAEVHAEPYLIIIRKDVTL